MDKSPALKLITTQDGSHSLLREDMNETYHSFHGARSESQYVFIQQCLEHQHARLSPEMIRVFEVGFGTGLNVWLSAIYASQHQLKVDFHTVEPFPVPASIYRELNYGQSETEKSLLRQLHDAPWGVTTPIHDHFSLTKYQTTLELFQSDLQFHCIYFDAFAPSKQSEVWSPENLSKCFLMTAPDGLLSTYCAQGQFKRNLKAAGYEMETLKGAMGKKEMVRGLKALQPKD